MELRKFIATTILEYLDENQNNIYTLIKKSVNKLPTQFCLKAAKNLSEELPNCEYKAGFFIHDKPLHDVEKHIFKSGYSVKISHKMYLQIKSIVKDKKLNILNAEDYINYHGWNEIKIEGKNYLLDSTVNGFDILGMMKEPIPYFDKLKKFILIDKNDIFYQRYIEDDNIKYINNECF